MKLDETRWKRLEMWQEVTFQEVLPLSSACEVHFQSGLELRGNAVYATARAASGLLN